ncbi:hypothetical protein B566_EDAN012679 [Ephemera danica]|nr:hypothetical protein B566_EDAN012679 [Ephemera danica]
MFFWRFLQALSISKAVNQTEQPIKEKHVRSTIIGTFHERGAGYFWNVGLRMPIQDNPIVAWKFCHLIHKVLREGHPNVLTQSQKHKSRLADFGKLWSPPNFLIQAELRSYVTPVVVMPEQSPVTEQHDSLEASVSSESTSLVDLLDLSPAQSEPAMVSQRLERALTEKSSLEAEVHDLLAQKMEVEERLEEAEQASRQREAQIHLDAENNMNAMFENCVKQAELMVRNALGEMDNPALSTLACSSGYLRDVCDSTEQSFANLGSQLDLLRAQDGEVIDLSAAITQAAHTFSWMLLLGKAVSQTATDIEIGDAMLDQCRQGGAETVSLLSLLSSRSTWGDAGAILATVRQNVQSLVTLAERLEGRSAPLESVADSVESELATMEKAIEEAAAKIEEMLTKSRQADSGVKLEVNEKILDACTGLMAAVRQLVITSRKLQGEIVAQGKGTASAKEFYKRNHQWTEGLISAAKAVAIGAHFLLEAADEAVSGKGKLELLVVAAQQIAAGTAQLVVASRVKAERDSKNLAAVSQASKGVSHATGAVVAAAKACREMVESADEQLDVSGLSLHGAKRLEMDSQVRVLELEASLQKERLRLAALRRHHYQLAGEAEGWEKKVISRYFLSIYLFFHNLLTLKKVVLTKSVA